MDLLLPDPLAGMIESCERHCVAGCCGTDAFDVAAAHIIDWGWRVGEERLWTALTQLEGVLADAAVATGQITGDRFNAWWPTAADCLHYFDDWRTEASRALAEVGGPAVVRPEWLTADVRGLVAGIVAARDFSRLPVLADALEDAGCDSHPVLAHLRAEGRHGWFCWVTDLLAGG